MAKHDKSEHKEADASDILDKLAEAPLNDEQLITNDMLDLKLDGIKYSSKMKTKADNKHEYKSVESMLELDYTGATLRDVIGWSFKDRRIAQQNVMRVLGQNYIESTPVVSVVAVDIKSNGVRVDMSPEAIGAKLVADGIDENEYIATLLKASAKQRTLLEQRAKDEADLMDGVEIPNE